MATFDQFRQQVINNPTWREMTFGMSMDQERALYDQLGSLPSTNIQSYIGQFAPGPRAGTPYNQDAFNTRNTSIADLADALQAYGGGASRSGNVPGAPPGGAGPVESVDTAVAAAQIRQAERELEFAKQQWQFSSGLQKQQLEADIRAREQDLAWRKEQFGQQLAWDRERFGQEFGLERDRFGLDQELGRGQLDLGRGRLGLDTELGRGQLDLGRGRLGLDTELGRGDLALREQQMRQQAAQEAARLRQQGALGAGELLSSLRGPRDWLAYRNAQAGLRTGGVPNQMDAILGQLGVQLPPAASPAPVVGSVVAAPGAGQPPATNGVAMTPPQPVPHIGRPAPVPYDQMTERQRFERALFNEATPAAGSTQIPGMMVNQQPEPTVQGWHGGPVPLSALRGNKMTQEQFRSLTPAEREMLAGAVEQAGGVWEDFAAQLAGAAPRAGAAAAARVRY